MQTIPLFDMFALDRESSVTLQRQLYDFLRTAILDGRLKAKTPVPATRALAQDLGIGRNTVINAYDALIAEGLLESVRGVGTIVVSLPENALRERNSDVQTALPHLSRRGAAMIRQRQYATIPGQIAFHPGSPEIGHFPFPIWRKIVARHAGRTGIDVHGYHQVQGYPRLREEIAAYLSVARGMKFDPDQVVVFAGAQAALDLICRLLVDEGEAVGIEEPGYAGANSAFVAAGVIPVPLYVDHSGWNLDMRGRPPRLIFVTPSCQWPLGRVMQMDERLQLLKFAEQSDAWIVEDDYDAEYRFRGPPLPALQGLDRSGRVIYVGTFSKTMFPALRVGFAVVPKQHVEGFAHALSHTGQYPPLFLQAALADFIGDGHFVAHLRRMRRLYATRQSTFLDLCARDLSPWLDVEERETGMQVLGRFVEPRDDRTVANAALRFGVDVAPLSTHYRFGPPRHGLLLGYAGVDERTMIRGVKALQKTFRSLE